MKVSQGAWICLATVIGCSTVALKFLTAAAAPQDRVTLTGTALSLVDLCRTLTEQTGVRHTVLPEGRRLRLLVFCQERPAEEVRRQVQELIEWRWIREGTDDRRRFLLVKDQPLRKKEAELRQQDRDRYVSLLYSEAEKAVRREPATDDSGLNGYFRLRGNQELLRCFAVLSPDVQRSVVAGAPYRVPAGRLGGGFKRELEQIFPPGKSTHLTGNTVLELALVPARTGRPQELKLSVLQRGEAIAWYNVMPSRVVDLFRRPATGPSLVGGRMEEYRRLGLFQPLTPAPPLEWPSPSPTAIGWALQNLARRVPELPLMADCYPEWEEEEGMSGKALRGAPLPVPEWNGQRPYEVLDRLRDQGYDWRSSGRWILLRHAFWYWEPLRPTASAPGR